MDAPQDNERDKGKGSLNQIARYSELAMVMPGGAIAGWFIGYLLDRHFGTHWMYLAGAAVGIIGGFVHIIRVALSDSRQ